jgi:di- and tripeptidase
VISAPSDGWVSDPFALSGRDGYLYGRGVTDNKGPILAVACAAAELLNCRSLAVDLIFLIEGEEERGSGGFADTVRRHRVGGVPAETAPRSDENLQDAIGHVDAILVSNSTWIAEYPPCITYGLRGVVHCGLEVCNAMRGWGRC